jgi:hypothetical protein
MIVMRTGLTVLKLCVAVAILGLAADALAQGQGGGRRGGFGRGGGMMGNNPLTLLRNPNVQKELELSDDQKKSVDDLNTDMRSSFQGLRDLSADERTAKIKEENDKIQKKVDDLLLPNQKERLDELQLQARGSQALTDPKVAEKLNLTDDQKQSLTKLASDYQQKRMDLFQGGGRPDMDAVNNLRTEENDKAMAILTADQKDQFTKMEGKIVDPSLLRGNFGGRGGRNRGNGGNGGNRGNGQPDA